MTRRRPQPVPDVPDDLAAVMADVGAMLAADPMAELEAPPVQTRAERREEAKLFDDLMGGAGWRGGT